MSEFWKHFYKKTGFNLTGWMNHNRENWKINLIGHMMEYLIEKRIDLRIPISVLHFRYEGRPCGTYTHITIEDIYRSLKDKISEAGSQA